MGDGREEFEFGFFYAVSLCRLAYEFFLSLAYLHLLVDGIGYDEQEAGVGYECPGAGIPWGCHGYVYGVLRIFGGVVLKICSHAEDIVSCRQGGVVGLV